MRLLFKVRTVIALAAVSMFVAVSAAIATTQTVDAALTTATDEVASIAVTLGGYVVLAFVAAIGLGAIGFGLKYVWRMFRGNAK